MVNDKAMNISSEAVLVAVGRKSNTAELFEGDFLPKMNGDKIIVDETFKTSIDNIYAIGDSIKGMQLAHVASSQGIYVAELLNGKTPSIDLSVIPSCVYTDPEIACVGLTENDAKEKGIPYRVGKYLTSANGKSMISMDQRGFIKIIFDENTDAIIGAQMMCARATDMIGEMATAIVNKLTSKQLVSAMRAHPTYNESIGEAVEDSHEGAIHAMPKRKK